jgi:hypothetical protein
VGRAAIAATALTTRFCTPGLNNYGVADLIQIGGSARGYRELVTPFGCMAVPVARLGGNRSGCMFEPFESGYDPGDPVDRTIMATRNALFYLRGLPCCDRQPRAVRDAYGSSDYLEGLEAFAGSA